MTLRRLAFQAAAIALACAGCAQPTVAPEPSINAPRKQVLVQFSDMTMHPETAQVLQGGTVAWINYSMNYQGVISFPLSTLSSFTCKDMSPNFSKTANSIDSIPIGNVDQELPWPCPLRPGTYAYQINLFAVGGAMSGGGMYDPQLTLDGKIVVK